MITPINILKREIQRIDYEASERAAYLKDSEVQVAEAKEDIANAAAQRDKLVAAVIDLGGDPEVPYAPQPEGVEHGT